MWHEIKLNIMSPIKILIATAFLLMLTACTPSTDDGPRVFLGSESATVLIEEFSDLQCPACAHASPLVEDLIRNNPDLAKFEYYHFPLPQHQWSFQAAEASECAGDQGKFFEYVDLAFKNQKNLTQDNLKSLAGQLGLNQAVFDECLKSRVKAGRVKADLLEGRKRGVDSTPSFYVNGEYVRFTNIDTFEGYLRGIQ